MLDRDYIKWGLYGGLFLVILLIILEIFVLIFCKTLAIFCLIFGWGIVYFPQKIINVFVGSESSIVLLSISLIFYFILGFLIGIIARRLYLMKYGNE